MIDDPRDVPVRQSALLVVREDPAEPDFDPDELTRPLGLAPTSTAQEGESSIAAAPLHVSTSSMAEQALTAQFDEPQQRLAASNVTRFLVARHGEASYERPVMSSFGGTLTQVGREQSRELGERLLSKGVDHIVTSELARAVQTAEIAGSILGLPVQVRENLHEYPAGDYIGLPPDPEAFLELQHAWPAGLLDVGVAGSVSGQEIFVARSRLSRLGLSRIEGRNRSSAAMPRRLTQSSPSR